MLKRPFFALLGLGAGVTLGAWAVRKAEEVQARLTPEHLARSASARAGSLGTRLREALEEGRAAAEQRERELRGRHRPPTAEDPQG